VTRATLAQASAWLLAVRSQFDIKEEAKDAKLAVRGPAASLVKTYDASAFTPESREAVSATLKWFREPDIRERLDVWVRVNTPEPVEPLPPEALAAPISMTAKWQYARFLKATDDDHAVRALSALRGAWDHAAFDWIVRHDYAAAGLAVRQGWKPAPSRDELATEWNDLDWILAKARVIRSMTCPTPWSTMARAECLKVFLLCVGLHGRQHLDAAVAELRSTEPVPVAFVEEVTLFGEVL
jgi:hypothetical protein